MKRITIVSIILLSACSSEAAKGPSGPGLAIDVAPLSLSGISDASYSITVKNRLGATEWTKGPLASSDFGDGAGALSYVGPCDASENPHSVELVVESLTSTTGALSSPGDYVNPTISRTGVRTPIVKSDVVCSANADTAVRFDLTILRSARQGFFDVAVELDDVFCSAKIDCKDALMLRSDGTRGPTAVLGFACTAGPGQQTNLYLSDLTLTCTGSGADVVTRLDVGAAADGQQGARAGLYQWSVYRDEEFTTQSDFEKCFWNFSLGLDTAALAGKSCHLTATGTAASTPLVATGSAYEVPTAGSYPVISWDVEVLTAGGALCTNNGLDVGGTTGVTTGYVTDAASAAALAPLTAKYGCGEGVEEPEPQPFACNATSQGTITASPTETGFTLAAAGVATATFTLPSGYRLGSACCAPECCRP